jgi:hypothetical protein
MKKSFLFVVLFLVPFVMKGQGIGLGIKGGANWANQDVSTMEDINTVTSYHLGAYVNLNFSDKWGITPEVLYSAYGTEWNNAKVDFDYVSIPVMLRFKPIDLVSLEAGPQFSLLTKANMENTGDVKDQLKSNDFGLAFGAGLHLPLGFNAGARYVLGFTDINDVSSTSIKNRVFQIYVGWTIFGAK